MKKIFIRYKNKNKTQRIAFTGVFFGLVLLFQFLEHYMPFGDTYLNLNFSLLFILPIFYYSGPIYGFLVIFLRFVIGPAMEKGYAPQFMIGHGILMISSLFTVSFMYLYSVLFDKVINKDMKLVYISVATVLSTSIVLTGLNGLLFTPLYWWAFEFIDAPSITDAKMVYPSQIPFFFGIPNYWGGIFAVYLSGNLVKFSLIYIVNYPMSKTIKHFY